MKAAVLEEFGRPLVVRDVEDPVAGPGEVLVEVSATCVLPYAAEVFSGERNYSLEPPVIPGLGGVARIVSVGPDSTRLRPGDAVWCDPTVRSRDDALTPDITLQGWSSRGPGGLELSRHFHDGSFAERMVIPTESAVSLGALGPLGAARWSTIGVPLVPYGGLLAAGLQAGETVLVSGATGNFGSAAVAVALAMGARRVVAPGRNEAVLADLVGRFGERVRTVVLTGDADTDRAAMMVAAGGPIDVVIDLLPPEAGAVTARTAVMTVREYGRAVLMGGVGMPGRRSRAALPVADAQLCHGAWPVDGSPNRQPGTHLTCPGRPARPRTRRARDLRSRPGQRRCGARRRTQGSVRPHGPHPPRPGVRRPAGVGLRVSKRRRSWAAHLARAIASAVVR